MTAGTWTLARLMLRRDRVVLPVWTLLIGALPAVYAGAFASLYPTQAGRAAFVASVASSPVESGLLGRVFGAGVGSLAAWRSAILLVLVGLATALTVVRHTRAEEEAGRLELLGAGVVGRHAPLAAALSVALVADVVVGLVCALALVGRGMPVGGSVALGLSFLTAGAVFGAVAAVAAQLTTSARAARGIAGGALATAYLVRAAGDAAGSDAVAALSPFGWLEQVRPYAGDRWVLLAPGAACALLLTAAAAALSARRDLGSGLLPARRGPAAAPARLRSPLALAWRLDRGTLLAWSLGFATLGGVLGASASSALEQLGSTPQITTALRRLGGEAGLADAFLAATLGALALGAAGYAVSVALRLRAEEVAGRAEPVLATSVPRLRWAGSHLVIAALGPAVLLGAAGLAAGTAYGLSTGQVARQVPRVVAGALVQLPAVWVLAGLAAALLGLLPRFAAAAWAALAGCLFLGQVGPLLGLAQPVLDLSPFTHLPRVPGGPVHTLPLLVLTVVAGALGGAGLLGLRHRDIG